MTLNSKINKQKLKIVQILPSLSSGGVERGTIDISKALVSEGHESIVISSGGNLVDTLLAFGIRHIDINSESKNPFVMLKNAIFLKKFLLEEKPDIVHVRSRAPAWWSRWACKQTNTHFLTTFHGIYKFSNCIKKAYNKIMTQGDLVVAISSFVKSHIIKHYNVQENKVRLVYRGADTEYFNPDLITDAIIQKIRKRYNITKQCPIILLPSRMTSWKGHAMLVEVLHKIRHLNFFCLMVGDLSKHPAFVSKIRERIIGLKLQSKVQIFGTESNMLGLYSMSDIVLSTSIEPEAFGRTVIEAQAMKKLVIASNIGGAAETIIDNVNGLHAIANDVDDWSKKITYALNILNTKTHQDIVEKAREFVVNHFSLMQMQEETLNVYKELTAL